MRLTIVQLRGYPSCESLTDEDANEIIEALYQISIAFFEHYSQIKTDNHGHRKNKLDSDSKADKKT